MREVTESYSYLKKLQFSQPVKWHVLAFKAAFGDESVKDSGFRQLKLNMISKTGLKKPNRNRLLLGTRAYFNARQLLISLSFMSKINFKLGSSVLKMAIDIVISLSSDVSDVKNKKKSPNFFLKAVRVCKMD